MGDAPEVAYADVVEVLSEDPDDFLATCVKGRCMFLMGDFERSLMVWYKARKMRGNVVEVMQDKVSHVSCYSHQGEGCHRKRRADNQLISTRLFWS